MTIDLIICCEVTEGILAEECGSLLTQFFRNLREQKKNQKRI